MRGGDLHFYFRSLFYPRSFGSVLGTTKQGREQVQAVSPQLRASGEPGMGGGSVAKRHHGFELSWGGGRACLWHRQKERRHFPLGGREEKQWLPGKGQDVTGGCCQHPPCSAQRGYTLASRGGEERTRPLQGPGCGQRGCKEVGGAGSTWVSSPLHSDELMGTCQRQNGWCARWQHDAQHQTQTHCQCCFPPLPLHSSLPFSLLQHQPLLCPQTSLSTTPPPATFCLVYSPARSPPTLKPQALKKGEGGTSAGTGQGEAQLQCLGCSLALLVPRYAHHLPGTPSRGCAKRHPSIWLPLHLSGQHPVIYFLIPFAIVTADPTAHATQVCWMAAWRGSPVKTDEFWPRPCQWKAPGGNSL